MEFSEDTQLIINPDVRNRLVFKAFLEDSDITYDMKDQTLPFAPTSFNNDSMMLRVLQKVKFTFGVFSEDRDECIRNYKNLLNLITMIKPSYAQVYDQYAPYPSNVTGYFFVKFKGLPLTQDTVAIHITNFAYTFNKDAGYLQVEPAEINNNKLIPLAYKLTIEGRVLLNFDQTANVTTPSVATVGQQREVGGLTAAATNSATVAITPTPQRQSRRRRQQNKTPTPAQNLKNLEGKPIGQKAILFYKTKQSESNFTFYDSLPTEKKLEYLKYYEDQWNKGIIELEGIPSLRFNYNPNSTEYKDFLKNIRTIGTR